MMELKDLLETMAWPGAIAFETLLQEDVETMGLSRAMALEALLQDVETMS
jgi:hypothetical protein